MPRRSNCIIQHMVPSHSVGGRPVAGAHPTATYRDRKQRTYIEKYSFVNRTIKNWNQLPAEALGTCPCKPNIFRKGVRKSIINGVK